jgi:hypothetical protein
MEMQTLEERCLVEGCWSEHVPVLRVVMLIVMHIVSPVQSVRMNAAGHACTTGFQLLHLQVCLGGVCIPDSWKLGQWSVLATSVGLCTCMW